MSNYFLYLLETRRHPLQQFIHHLLKTYDKSWNIRFEETDKYLIYFCITEGFVKQSNWIKDYGFSMICLQEKLKILRHLLECQLENHKSVLAYTAIAKGPEIRHIPLGRDHKGNIYWEFLEGKTPLVLKELINETEIPFCQVIRTQLQARELFKHVETSRSIEYCGKDRCKQTKGTTDSIQLKCIKCNKKWHSTCVKDWALRWTCNDWACPNCEHQMLLDQIVQKFFCEE